MAKFDQSARFVFNIFFGFTEVYLGGGTYLPWGMPCLPSVSIREVAWDPAIPIRGVMAVAAFILLQQRRVLATETFWPGKLKIFTVLTFTESMCWLLT